MTKTDEEILINNATPSGYRQVGHRKIGVFTEDEVLECMKLARDDVLAGSTWAKCAKHSELTLRYCPFCSEEVCFDKGQKSVITKPEYLNEITKQKQEIQKLKEQLSHSTCDCVSDDGTPNCKACVEKKNKKNIDCSEHCRFHHEQGFKEKEKEIHNLNELVKSERNMRTQANQEIQKLKNDLLAQELLAKAHCDLSQKLKEQLSHSRCDCISDDGTPNCQVCIDNLKTKNNFDPLDRTSELQLFQNQTKNLETAYRIEKEKNKKLRDALEKIISGDLRVHVIEDGMSCKPDTRSGKGCSKCQAYDIAKKALEEMK